MSAKLSVCIPIYNFAKFIPETLDSIVAQDGADEIEIVVLDGASTDNTPEIIAGYQAKHPNINYVRLPAKGGIDRDMARSVEHASGDYCWLFSGDDIMHPGAIRTLLREMEGGEDLFLCKHKEWRIDLKEWVDWPTVDVTAPTVFELSDPAQRLNYFAAAVNTEALFSFMGGTAIKRATWNRVPYNEEFDGSLWALAARMFELMQTGLSVKVTTAPVMDRRPDNDSFMGRGLVHRMGVAIDGFHAIADRFFGHDSKEAFHVRRVIRNEFSIGMLLLGKFMCELNPAVESKARMDELVAKAYCDFSWKGLKTRFDYATISTARYRKYQPEITASFERQLRAGQEAKRAKSGI